MKTKKLFVFMLLFTLFLPKNGLSLEIVHGTRIIKPGDGDFTFAKSIWSNNSDHKNTFNYSNRTNYLLIDDILLPGTLMISSYLCGNDSQISLFRLEGTSPLYATNLVKTWSGSNVVGAYYIEQPGEFLVEAVLTGINYPHIFFDFFPDKSGDSCTHLAPGSGLTCEQSWLPAHYRMEVEPWIRALVDDVIFAINATNEAKRIADFTYFLIDSAVDSTFVALDPEHEYKLLLAQKAIQLASYVYDFENDTECAQLVGYVNTTISHVEDIRNLLINGWNPKDPNFYHAWRSALNTLADDAVTLATTGVVFLDLDELEEKYNETKIAWVMLETFIEENYGDSDSLAIRAGLNPADNPTIYEIIDGIAASLDYDNSLFDTAYDPENVNSLFNQGVMDFGDWVSIRRTLDNPLDDVDGDGILNREDSEPNEPKKITPPFGSFSIEGSFIIDNPVNATSTSTDESGAPACEWFLYEPSTASSTRISITSRASFTPDKTGTYTLKLVVTNSHGLSDEISKAVTISPQPVAGHNLELNTCQGPTSIRPGGTYNFDINVCNTGVYSENITATLTVSGPSVNNGFVQASLGSIAFPTGATTKVCKPFQNILSYKMPSSLADGYYSFAINVKGEIGDENWSDNMHTVNVRYGEAIPVYSNAFEQKGHYTPYDPNLEITQYSDLPFDGGYGKITVTTPYGTYYIWHSEWLERSDRFYTYFFIESTSGFTEYDEKVYESDMEVFDDGRLLIGAQYPDNDASWIVAAWPADHKVRIEPETAITEVNQEYTFSIFMPEKGACCFSDRGDWHSYNPGSNRPFNLDDEGFRYVIDADGTRVDHGYDLTVRPLQAGVHDFVAEIDGQNGTNFFVIGQIKATVPVVDTDGDGEEDGVDAFPNDPAASMDSDNDGYPDAWNTGKTQSDSTTGLILDLAPYDPNANRDSDDDGILDYYDAFPNDPSEQYDSDGDGVGDHKDVTPKRPVTLNKFASRTRKHSGRFPIR